MSVELGPSVGSKWRHQKTGGVYLVLSRAMLQTSQKTGVLADTMNMVVYMSMDQHGVFVREVREFLERFAPFS